MKYFDRFLFAIRSHNDWYCSKEIVRPWNSVSSDCTIASNVFSPTTVLALKSDIQRLADQLIDKLVDRGECDFMPEIAEPLPVTVFLRMLGLPVERMWEFRGIIHTSRAGSCRGVAAALYLHRTPAGCCT